MDAGNLFGLIKAKNAILGDNIQSSPISLPTNTPISRDASQAFEKYYDTLKPSETQSHAAVQEITTKPRVHKIQNMQGVAPDYSQKSAGDRILNSLHGIREFDPAMPISELTRADYTNPVFVLDLQVYLAELTINNHYQQKLSQELNTQIKQQVSGNS